MAVLAKKPTKEVKSDIVKTTITNIPYPPFLLPKAGLYYQIVPSFVGYTTLEYLW